MCVMFKYSVFDNLISAHVCNVQGPPTRLELVAKLKVRLYKSGLAPYSCVKVMFGIIEGNKFSLQQEHVFGEVHRHADWL